MVTGLLAVLFAMSGLVYYSVPLYRLFCQVTGFGGTTQRTDEAAESKSDQMITVRFDANLSPGLPWRFHPLQRQVRLRLGEQAIVYFVAENLSDQTVVAASTFNVTPQRTGAYFNKIQCFCFDQQRLGPGEKVNMPVLFFVDPTLGDEPKVRNIETITLSYTFFESQSPEDGKDLKRLDDTFASAEGSRPLQAANLDRGRLAYRKCVGCHSLEPGNTRAGPSLANLFGRQAGELEGYQFSQAMRSSDLLWDEAILDQFLTAPAQFVKGTKMAFPGLKNRQDRRDLIAFLKALK